MGYYAHSLEGQPETEWQLLSTHLQNTAELASCFAEDFGCGSLARIFGLLHDLGKYSPEFQNYLAGKTPNAKVDHSTAGARFLAEKMPVLKTFLPNPVAGHHAGLPNWYDGSESSLSSRLDKGIPDWKNPESESIASSAIPAKEDLPKQLTSPFAAAFFNWALTHDIKRIPQETSFAIFLLCRMLFSCLVDADYLDTEKFMAPSVTSRRPVWSADILTRMRDTLDTHLAKFKPDSPVNRLRADILEQCNAAAELPPGLFSLTVPTGGGKTLSSLSFALRHAVKHGKKRVIYVIPFISIIEQNADCFRKVFNDFTPCPVLEAHSAVALDTLSENDDEKDMNRLSTENFDVPLTVTTSVQFYESLMAAAPSRCRKLHNFSNSVIILDEVQKIPVQYLKLIIALFQELATTYRSTLVLCTATQPVIVRNQFLEIGLREPPKEIIADPIHLHDALRRTEAINLGKQTDLQLLERFKNERQMLCIVNTRAHAQKLFHALDRRKGDFHLSTNMVAAHRFKVLERIRKRLAFGLPCRVISTQLVEAGVDVDFPVVFRASAGCDSLAQANGRCNREGKLPALGKVYLFESEYKEKEKFQLSETNCADRAMSGQSEPLGLEVIRKYFQFYFYDQKSNWDRKDIFSCFTKELHCEFREAAEKFKLIDEDSEAVLVPYGEGEELLRQLREAPAMDFSLLRKLQRFTVNVRKKVFQQHLGTEIELIHGICPALVSTEKCYDKKTGLLFENEFASFF